LTWVFASCQPQVKVVYQQLQGRFRKRKWRWPLLIAIAVNAVFGIAATVTGADQSGHSAVTDAPEHSRSDDRRQPIDLAGTGSSVREIDFPAGNYRLRWSAVGHGNFMVDLEGTESSNLVNEIAPDPASGEAFARIGGGHYALNIQAATLSWTLSFVPLGN
jgi:hypothetical protein